MILKSMLKGSETLSKSISYGIAKSILAASMPGIGRKLMSTASFYIGETIAKMLFISSSASGVRWIIDKIFGT